MKVLINLLNRYYLFLFNIQKNNYYLSIRDLPISNWWALNRGEIKYLHRKQKVNNKLALKIVSEGLFEEFVSIFGISKKYSDVLQKRIELELIRINVALTGDRSGNIFAKVLEAEIKSEEDKGVAQEEILVHVEKQLGFKINTKEVSVYEYYNYVNTVEKWLKARK